GVGATRFPGVQVSLRFLQTFEAPTFQWRFLRMSDAGFHFSFAIGIMNSARQCDHAVVRQYVLEQRIESGIVNVGREHAFFQVIQYDDARAAAEPTKRRLMQLSPRARAGTKDE